MKSILAEPSLWIFLLIGAINTVLSLSLQMIFYSFFHWGYWGSSATAFLICSIISFYCNRKYSFKSTGKIWASAIKFSINILICYLIAYSIAKPLMLYIIAMVHIRLLNTYASQLALIMGNVLFTVMNYFGQRFFAFASVPPNTEHDQNLN